MAWTAYIQSILLLIHISNSDSYQVFQCRKVHTHKMRPTMGLRPLQSRIKIFIPIFYFYKLACQDSQVKYTKKNLVKSTNYIKFHFEFKQDLDPLSHAI